MIRSSLVILITCTVYLSCDFGGSDDLKQKDIIDLGIEAADPIIADASDIFLQVKIPSNSSEEFRSITFEKSGGTFLGVNTANPVVKVNEEGTTGIGLRLPQQPGSLFLRAIAGSSFSADTILNLGISYPDKILVEPQTRTISRSQNSVVVINVKMIKSEHKPSIGISAEFNAFQGSDTIGRFVDLFNAVSNSEGTLSATFQTIAGEVKLDEPVIIDVCINNDSNERICNSSELVVIE